MLTPCMVYALKALVFALVLVGVIVGVSKTKEGHYGSRD